MPLLFIAMFDAAFLLMPPYAAADAVDDAIAR